MGIVHTIQTQSRKGQKQIVFSFSLLALNAMLLPAILFCYRKYRYRAYHQFTRWVHQKLGRRNRVVLPSCTTCRIWQEFPSADGMYWGFKYWAPEGIVYSIYCQALQNPSSIKKHIPPSSRFKSCR